MIRKNEGGWLMNKVKTKPLIYLVIASACLLVLLTFIALYTHRNNRSFPCYWCFLKAASEPVITAVQ